MLCGHCSRIALPNDYTGRGQPSHPFKDRRPETHKHLTPNNKVNHLYTVFPPLISSHVELFKGKTTYKGAWQSKVYPQNKLSEQSIQSDKMEAPTQHNFIRVIEVPTLGIKNCPPSMTSWWETRLVPAATAGYNRVASCALTTGFQDQTPVSAVLFTCYIFH
jgi:hypothetical protein